MKTFLKLILFSLLTFTLASCQSYVESMIRERMAENQEKQAALLSSEKMHIFLLGTGGPLANETRDSSGVAIIAGGEFIIVDVGPGIVRNMSLLNLPNSKLSALCLTHYHSDHISDMGELSFNSFVGGRAQKLDLYGPEGVEQAIPFFDKNSPIHPQTVLSVIKNLRNLSPQFCFFSKSKDKYIPSCLC